MPRSNARSTARRSPPARARRAYSGLAAASHTFQVRQTDTAGNTGVAASYTWTIDTTAPGAPSITLGPTGLINQTSASFSFTGEAGASFQCALDGAAFAACTSPKAYSGLADGAHAFQVRQIDTAGNTGPRRAEAGRSMPRPLRRRRSRLVRPGKPTEPRPPSRSRAKRPPRSSAPSTARRSPPARARSHIPVLRRALTRSRCARRTPPETLARQRAEAG